MMMIGAQDRDPSRRISAAAARDRLRGRSPSSSAVPVGSLSSSSSSSSSSASSSAAAAVAAVVPVPPSVEFVQLLPLEAPLRLPAVQVRYVSLRCNVSHIHVLSLLLQSCRRVILLNSFDYTTESAQACRHFQRGNCKFGAHCYFHHPGRVTVGGSALRQLDTITIALNQHPEPVHEQELLLALQEVRVIAANTPVRCHAA